MPRIWMVRREPALLPARVVPQRQGSLEPLDVDEKQWSLWSYLCLAASLAIQPQAYLLSFMALGFGLSCVWMTVGAFIASVLVVCLAATSSHCPAKYGIPLSVAARTSFGRHGSRLYDVLFICAAVPWAALLTMAASEGVSEGLIGVHPSLRHYSPLPQSWVLPRGLSFFRLSVLVVIALLLFTWMVVPKDMAVTARRMSRFSLSCSVGVVTCGLMWANEGHGLDHNLRAYNKLRAHSHYRLYVTVPLFIITATSCWSTLALGLGDLARYARRRDTPSSAFFLTFPILNTLTTLAGAIIIGAVYRTNADADMRYGSPLAVMGLVEPYRALPMGFAFAVAALHVVAAGYGVSASNCIADLAPRYLNARGGAAIFVAGSVVLAGCYGVLSPPHLREEYWAVDPSRMYTAAFSLTRWSQISGIISGGLLAVILADYHAIRRRKLPTEYLYQIVPLLHYGGCNGAAVLSLILSYGLAGLGAYAMSRAHVRHTGAVTHEAHYVGFAVSFIVGLISYSLLFTLFTRGRSTRVSQSSSPTRSALEFSRVPSAPELPRETSYDSTGLAQELATTLHALLTDGPSAPQPGRIRDHQDSVNSVRSCDSVDASRRGLYPRLPPVSGSGSVVDEETKMERYAYAHAVTVV